MAGICGQGARWAMQGGQLESGDLPTSLDSGSGWGLQIVPTPETILLPSSSVKVSRTFFDDRKPR